MPNKQTGKTPWKPIASGKRKLQRGGRSRRGARGARSRLGMSPCHNQGYDGWGGYCSPSSPCVPGNNSCDAVCGGDHCVDWNATPSGCQSGPGGGWIPNDCYCYCLDTPGGYGHQ